MKIKPLTSPQPDVQYNTTHPVYPVLQKIGREITSLRPKAVVVFSGHWQSTPINVNTAASTDLIYDFYGFPSHFYKATYPNVGSPELASRILALLESAAIPAEGVRRGLDHGVWSGFNVAFDPAANPLGCPLVQVSLFSSEDPGAHYALGRAVASLRDEGVVVIGAGMSVHNLRDFRFGGAGGRPMPYAVSFDEALRDACLADPAEREGRMAEACKRADARQAHPWMDHLMPVYVAAGAAAEEKGTQIWTMQEASFAWAQYRFGEVPKEAEEKAEK